MKRYEHSGEGPHLETAHRQGSEPIAVVGLSCMFPGARNTREYWRLLREGIDAIREVPETHWSPDDYYDEDPASPDRTYGYRGGFLDPHDFNPMEFGISPRDLESTDTTQLLGLAVAKAALEDAGYGDGGALFDRERVSVILGVTGALELVVPLGARLGHPVWRRALAEAGVDPQVAEEVVERISNSYVPWQESSFPGLLGNVAAGRIANRLDLKGTNCVVDAACASSLSALHLAVLELEAGRSDMALAGGIDTFNDIFMYMCFSKTPALSPTGDARPFAADGDGTILGEGLGVLVLKRLSDAERDRDRIYAVIKGIGSSSDGKGMAVYAPSHEGQARALDSAYDNAGVSPTTVELVEGHGTGTRVGDAVEVKGLTEVYRKAKEEGTWCALGSAKSQIGHTKAAAGAAGLIKAVLALYHRVLPPTIKVDQPNDAVATGQTPFYVNTDKRPWLPREDHPRRAGVSSFGFGGTNFHCVLEEHDHPVEIDWDGDVQLFSVSGDTKEEVVRQLQSLRDGLSSDDWEKVRIAAAATREEFRSEARCRLLAVAERHGTPLETLLEGAIGLIIEKGEVESWATPQGLYWGCGSGGSEVAALFPGQGSQYPGMLRDLACQFPQMAETLEHADTVFAGEILHETGREPDQRLSDRIYPISAFDEQTRQDQEGALRATDVAQPALGAVSLGALRVLEHFGLKVAAAVGHSYGELVALCSSGRLGPIDLHRLSRLRGRLMNAAGSGDRGSMLAIRASVSSAQEFIEKYGLDLVIANRNSPIQVVLSGSSDEITRAEGLLEDEGIRGKRLSVAAAFHSDLVGAAARPFAEALRNVRLGEDKHPVMANTTGYAYPPDDEETKNLLGGQLAAPVEFVKAVESICELGVRTFVEIGPGRRLGGLVHEILGDEGTEAIITAAIDASSGERHGVVDLGRTLAQLAARGATVALSKWDEGARHVLELAVKNRPSFSVPISGANYVAARGQQQPSPRAPMAAPLAARGGLEGFGEASDPSQQPVDATLLEEALRLTQDSVAALLRLQEHTAELHRLFIEGQDQVAKHFHTLMERQNVMLASGVGLIQLSTMQPAIATPPPAASIDSLHETPAVSEAATPEARELTAREAQTPAGQSGFGSRSEAVGSGKELDPTSFDNPNRYLEAAPRDTNRVAPVLLEVVSEKTGYPVEMLDLSMGLDADLGIDSIKRVEILSALSERLPEASQVDPEQLGELETLEQVATALSAKGPPGAMDVDSRVLESGSPLSSAEQAPGVSPDAQTLDDPLRAGSTGAVPRPSVADPVQRPTRPRTPVPRATEPEPTSPSPSLSSPTSARPSAPDSSSLIAATLLEVVAEKTGYPVEMLDLSMGLDADLGIDSIKRVEILSALTERLPDTQVVEAEQLAELQTLLQVANALASSAAPAIPDSPPAMADSVAVLPAPAEPLTTGEAQPSASAVPADSGFDVSSLVLEVVAEKTGYPVEMLDLSMGLDADLGIDSIKRVEILSALEERVPEGVALARVAPEELGALETLDQVARALAPNTPRALAPNTQLSDSEVSSALREPQAASPAPTQTEPPDTRAVPPSSQVASSTEKPPNPGPDRTQVETLLLEVVAEKTGYPVEMLDLSMGLDADLGIDSIKRVEIMSNLEEQLPQISRLAPERLGELQTLAEVAGALAESLPALTRSAAATSESVGTAHSESSRTTQRGPASVSAPDLAPGPGPAVAVPVGVRRLVVRPARAGEANGAVLLPGARIWVSDSRDALSAALVGVLLQRGYRAEMVAIDETKPVPDDLAGLVIAAPSSRSQVPDQFLLHAFLLAQRVAPTLEASTSREGALFATVSRLDGAFGLRGIDPSISVTSGGLTGLAKTASHEWSGVVCRSIDLDSSLGAAIAPRLGQVLLEEGPAEIGLEKLETNTLALRDAPLEAEDLAGRRLLDQDDVVVVTGGARGVTSDVVRALATAGSAHFVLLGRTVLEPVEPAWLSGLSDEAEIKRALLTEARASGERVTPRHLEDRYRRIASQREIRDNLESLRLSGASVEYLSLDVRDGEAVERCIKAIVDMHGGITGLVHGAGVLADRLIEDQTPDDWSWVYDTKVAGMRSLLDALREQPLRNLVLFSSSTARFGRRGQVAYAMANEVLNKLAQREQQLRPDCRVVSVNWGPWDGGMVDDALKALFREEGIEVVGRSDGANYLIAELSARSRDVEVLVLGAGSRLAELEDQIDPLAERIVHSDVGEASVDVEDTIDTAPRAELGQQLAKREPSRPQVVLAQESWALAIQRLVSVDDHRFLRSHVMNGRAVLPASMMVEWLAHGALHGQPGLRFQGFDELRVLKGVRINGETVRLDVETSTPEEFGDNGTSRLIVPARLTSVDSLGQTVLHARARIVLGSKVPAAPEVAPALELARFSTDIDVYREYLFHGPAFHGMTRVESCGDEGIVVLAKPSEPPHDWMESPLRSRWIADPLVLDIGFQMLIVWSQQLQGLGSLPAYIESYRQFVREFPREELRVQATIVGRHEHRANASIDWMTQDGTLIARMTGYECVIDGSLNKAFALNTLESAGRDGQRT